MDDDDEDKPFQAPARAVAELPRALKVVIDLPDGEQREMWVPKSAIHDDSEVFGALRDNSTGKLVLQAWYAREEGLSE